MEDARQGELAIEASNWTQAIEHYSTAIKKSPSAVGYYIKRSIAWLRSGKPDESLLDAEKAVVLATERGKRELIAEAQLRRAIALYQKGALGDAQYLFDISEKRNPKEKTLSMWKARVNQELKKLPEGDERRKVVVEEVPKITREPTADGSAVTAAEPSSAQTTANQNTQQKIRHDWYQSADKVIISILVKGAKQDQVTVDLKDQYLAANVDIGNGNAYDLTLDPLFASINLETSGFKVMSTKVEITLVKTTPGQQWPSLEGTNVQSIKTASAPASSEPPKTGPSYPTSSRNGPKNWDKIADSYVRPKGKEKKDGENEAEQEEDEYIDDEFEDGDPVNGFFKKLYAGASDDTKRAMMKSYQESGGTALSTNWGEVGKKRVEVSPPDGMEEKKWES